MKKILSVTMALCIVIASLFTGMVAMAEGTKPTTSKIKAQITGAVDFTAKDVTEYTVDRAVDFLTVINSGKDVSAYKDGFVKSVKENLDTNNARILVAHTEYDDEWNPIVTMVESPATYGAVILALDALGYNPQAFFGYNIENAYSLIDLKNNFDNPYYYRVALQGAEKARLGKNFTKEICNSLISKYYVKGSGLDWYGFSCDNTCQFAVAMAPYYNDYKDVVDDALALIETYKKDNGYFSDVKYIPDANANSTALALAAYSAMGNIQKAEAVYADLCRFESKNVGVFTCNGEEDLYATKDALFGLEAFLSALPVCYDGHKYTSKIVVPTCTEDGYTIYTCSVCGDNYKVNPIKATGHNFGVNAQKCSVCGTENPSYKIPTVTGVAVKSKTTSTITLVWDKAVDVTEYAVYKFNNSTNQYDRVGTVGNSANSYKVSKLKAGTVYQFKVAAVVNGKVGTKSNYIKASTAPAKAVISSASSPSKKSIKVKIGSVACSGYQLQWSTKKKFSSNYKSVTFSSSTKTKTIKTSQRKKTYYVRVRAYRTVNGKKVYGSWSTVKAVKTK